MAIVVEDATGLPTANAYVSAAACLAYAQDRGLTFTNDSAGEAAIIRASKAIDARYREGYGGVRLKYRLQGLGWPRAGAVDRDGYYIAITPLPVEIVAATCEAAVRELANPGSMQPDLERGGDIRSITAGSVGIVYGPGAVTGTTYDLIDGIMAPLIGSGGRFSGRSVRA